jgi:hypothetical protein
VAALQGLVASQQRHIDFLLRHAQQHPQAGSLTGDSANAVSPIAPRYTSSSRKRERASARRKGRTGAGAASDAQDSCLRSPAAAVTSAPPKTESAPAPLQSAAARPITTGRGVPATATDSVRATAQGSQQPTRQSVPYRESAWSATAASAAVSSSQRGRDSGAANNGRGSTSCGPGVQELLRMRTGQITFDDVLRAATARGPSATGRVGSALAPQMPTSTAPSTARPRTRESQQRLP